MPLFPVISGIVGLAAIIVFMSAIRHSYAVEARSDPRKAGRRFGYTNIWAVALNIGVAGDEETQSLRRAVLVRLGAVAALFAVLILGLVVMPDAA
ncbi:hypothetical protein CSC94_05045 [Zhengella mangrovi]|uniref:Uncharacterized protein n=1 Tax=Zhengella mangrovi TaxID=1982044 RepID=A0A2G1QRF3_9HYPH|nr:hypothetical protein [Zhengella mangrovi]PHP68034.1 hypothetical protein CSC94_05045 [Zhengella mangrovi]